MVEFYKKCFSDEIKIGTDKKLKFYVNGTGSYLESTTWPLQNQNQLIFHLCESHRLEPTPSKVASDAPYKVDFSYTTGMHNRWLTQNGGQKIDYSNLKEQSGKVISFQTEPFNEEVTLAGNPKLEIYLSANSDHFAIYSYLEAVSPSGEIIYLSEGQLSSKHINSQYLKNNAFNYKESDVIQFELEMYWLSTLLPKDYSLRVSFAGHDSSVFKRIPEQGEVEFKFYFGESKHSKIVLPIIGG
jgi:predicted acyl esterase